MSPFPFSTGWWYVDGENLYQGFDSNPVTMVDPSGLGGQQGKPGSSYVPLPPLPYFRSDGWSPGVGYLLKRSVCGRQWQYSFDGTHGNAIASGWQVHEFGGRYYAYPYLGGGSAPVPGFPLNPFPGMSAQTLAQGVATTFNGLSNLAGTTVNSVLKASPGYWIGRSAGVNLQIPTWDWSSGITDLNECPEEHQTNLQWATAGWGMVLPGIIGRLIGPAAAESELSVGTNVTRNWGGNSGPFGQSWTTDPLFTQSRNSLGLETTNTAEFVCHGTVVDTAGITTREALPWGRFAGGGQETLVPNATTQIQLNAVTMPDDPLPWSLPTDPKPLPAGGH